MQWASHRDRHNPGGQACGARRRSAVVPAGRKVPERRWTHQCYRSLLRPNLRGRGGDATRQVKPHQGADVVHVQQLGGLLGAVQATPPQAGARGVHAPTPPGADLKDARLRPSVLPKHHVRGGPMRPGVDEPARRPGTAHQYPQRGHDGEPRHLSAAGRFPTPRLPEQTPTAPRDTAPHRRAPTTPPSPAAQAQPPTTPRATPPPRRQHQRRATRSETPATPSRAPADETPEPDAHKEQQADQLTRHDACRRELFQETQPGLGEKARCARQRKSMKAGNRAHASGPGSAQPGHKQTAHGIDGAGWKIAKKNTPPTLRPRRRKPAW